MSSPANLSDAVMVAVTEHTAFAKVFGRGSFKNSPQIKEFGHAIMRGGREQFVIDLGDCDSMDSTFMGVLAGMSLEFRDRRGHPLTLVNLSDKLHALTQMLGLHHLVRSFRANEPLPDYASALEHSELKPIKADIDETERRDLVRDAHRTLSELSEENRLRFKDVLSYLEEDADSAS